MCGRYTLRKPLSVLAEQFLFDLEDAKAIPRYNIAPTQDVLAVRQPEQGAKCELVALRWGLTPVWAKDAKIGYSTINARGDTVATKPAFRSAFKKRRCLILADPYYEWLRDGKAKLPHLYEIEGGEPFAMAGLWEWWGGPDGKTPLESCSIITTDANKLASKIHDRMPVILDPKDYPAWLDPENNDTAKLQRLLVPFKGKGMTARPVSQFVNGRPAPPFSTGLNNPDIVERLQSLAQKMVADLGQTGVGPGCRPLGRISNPHPLIDNDGDVRPELVGPASRFP